MTDHLFFPVRLNSAIPGKELTFTCFVCGQKVTLRKEGDVMEDLKGPPYKAYYCLECYYKEEPDEKKSEIEAEVLLPVQASQDGSLFEVEAEGSPIEKAVRADEKISNRGE